MARHSEVVDGIDAGALTRLVDGEIAGPSDVVVRGVAELTDAGPADVAFIADRARAELLSSTRAGLVIVPRALEIDASAVPDTTVVVHVDDPRRAIAAVLEHLYPQQRAAPGVHETAVIDATATIGDGAAIGARAVLGALVAIGERTEIGAGSFVADGVRIGADCLLHPNVTVYAGTTIGDRVVLHAGAVIGADGFGFARDGEEQVKIPQVGGVAIEDDVEIGANACIDRGTLRATRIGAGTKIDNLVQVGHNCDIGRGCALSGLTGLSGSTVLEDGVIVGGNVGTAGHQVIGRGSMLAARSGVHGDLPPGSVVGGSPHMDIGVWRRVVASLGKLPELIRRVRRLERAVDDLREE